jgi:hypothetical protein
MAKRKLIVPGSEADVMVQGLKNPKKLLNFLANQSKNTGTRVPLKNAGQGKVFASDVWKGYADKPGGQRLVISGTPASSSVKVSPLGEGPQGSITKKFYPATYEPSEYVSRVNQEPRPKNSGWVSKMVLGDQNPPRSSIGYLPNRQSVGDAWTDAMRHRTYNPDIYWDHIAGEDILGRPVTREQADQPTDFQYTHGDPRRSYVFGDMMAPGVGSAPLPEGVVYPTFTPRGTSNGNMGYRKHLLNIGNILNRMGPVFQGVDDRLERNRINRLMRFNPDPYYGRGLY